MAGCRLNDTMGIYVASQLVKAMTKRRIHVQGSRVLVLGLTFKEDVPDLRNSKVADLIGALKDRGHAVTVHDPHADAAEAQHEYGLAIDADALSGTYDLVLLAVSHREYVEMGADPLRARLAPDGTLADLKGVLGGAADWTL